MKKSLLQKIVSAAIISLGAIAVSLPAQAGSLINDWEYARDDYNYDGSGSGGFNVNSRYDFYGMGFKRVGNEMFVGISTTYVAGASGTTTGVGYGDLFLDFNYGKPNNSFSAAQGALVGIRFAPNDTNTGNGVFTEVKGKSVASTNNGYGPKYNNLKGYNDLVKSNNSGQDSHFGDLAWIDPNKAPNAPENLYFADYRSGANSIPNVIDTGKYANGSVRTLSAGELASFASIPVNITYDANKKTVFGFAFTLPEELRGNAFLATLGFECSNDTISGYVPKAVPVPPAIAGIIAAGAFGGWRAARRKKQVEA